MEFSQEIKDKIKEVLLQKGNKITDDDIHALADELKIDTPELEAYIYKLAYKGLTNENSPAATPASVNGAGPVALPGNPGSQDGFFGQHPGSGDVPASLGSTGNKGKVFMYTQVPGKILNNIPTFEQFVNEEYYLIESNENVKEGDIVADKDTKKKLGIWKETSKYKAYIVDDEDKFVKWESILNIIKYVDENIMFEKYISDETRAEYEKKGWALEGGRFPIGDKQDLKNAIHAIGRAKKEDRSEVKKHIIKQAHRLNAVDLIPETWK